MPEIERTGVLRAMVERSVELRDCEKEVNEVCIWRGDIIHLTNLQSLNR